MARQETKYIVIHCSQTRPSQKDVDAKWIDRYIARGVDNDWLWKSDSPKWRGATGSSR